MFRPDDRDETVVVLIGGHDGAFRLCEGDVGPLDLRWNSFLASLFGFDSGEAPVDNSAGVRDHSAAATIKSASNLAPVTLYRRKSSRLLGFLW